MDVQSFGAVGRLLAVASMFVTVINNFWRHGDIDLTGRYANMRKIYGRAIVIGVILAAIARLNIIAMLRTAPAFDSYLSFPGADVVDDVIGVLATGVVLGFLSKFWNDLFDLLFETKRFMRGKANQLRADDQPRTMREPRNDMRDVRRGRRGSRGGRGSEHAARLLDPRRRKSARDGKHLHGIPVGLPPVRGVDVHYSRLPV